jgi:hypothetical protein
MLKKYRNKDMVTAVQYNGENKNDILTTFPLMFQDESGFLCVLSDNRKGRKQILPGQYLGRYLHSNKYCIWDENDFIDHFEEIGE